MVSRAEAAAEALASVRAEGLEPDEATVDLLERWVRGEISDDQLADARRHLAAGGTPGRMSSAS